MTNANFDELWERRVVTELIREHASICRLRMITLRPITIALFDSETRWGQFSQITRAILISRQLVQNHPWQYVVGVLQHEMAHQLVAESQPEGSTFAGGHDREFRAACERLRVPEQFARAGVDLQSGLLDWRSEKRDEKTEKILDRIRKLLSLANSSNEHEALLAMERVRELYAKYNLENEDAASGYVHLVLPLAKRKIQGWQQRALSLLLEHFFVEIITFQQFDPHSKERRIAVEFIGKRENVIMAEYVFYFLYNQLESSIQNVVKTQNRKLGIRERNSFRLGILDGFATKLKSAERSSSNSPGEAPALTLIGRALIKVKEDGQLSDYLKQMYPNMRARKTTRRMVDLDAFYSGRAVGRELTLNKPLSSQMGNLGRQLPPSGR